VLIVWQRARRSSGASDIRWPVLIALSCWPNGAPRYRLLCWSFRSVVRLPVVPGSHHSLEHYLTSCSRQRREDNTLGQIYRRRSLRSDRFHRSIGRTDRLPRSRTPWLGSVADLGTLLFQQHAMAVYQHHREKSGEVSQYACKSRAEFREMTSESAWRSLHACDNVH
jgi:hypothetical protein